MSLAEIQWPLILAGLGLFLFGIEYMGEGLKNFSGDKLRNIIDKYTSNPLKGIIIGAIVTCLIQSSSGTTALTIGLIRSGLMTLEQSVGIIMGANIGTVITSVLVGLKISEYAVYFISLGAFIIMFSKDKKKKYLGQIVFGFGCLFYGLDLMGNNLAHISEVPEFSVIVKYLIQNPLLGLIGGTLLTAAIQSSAAVIAVAQQLFASGAINLYISLPILFGSNIGTTITAAFAAMGGSLPAKRAATFHFGFNVIGTFIFMCLLAPFNALMNNIIKVIPLQPEMQIALAHAIFNTVTTLLLYPFVPKAVMLIKKILPSKGPELEMDLSELDPHVVRLFPSHALEIAKRKILEMGYITYECVEHVKEYLLTKNSVAKEAAEELENAINTLDIKITEYLILISHEVLNDRDSSHYLANMKTIKDLERIGDLSINLVRFIEAIYDERDKFSEEAKDDLIVMFNMVLDMMDKTLLFFNTQDIEIRDYIDEKESELDYFNKEAKQRHIKRVTLGIEKSALVNSTYVDLLSNLERMGDHCQNISEAYTIIEMPTPMEIDSSFINK